MRIIRREKIELHSQIEGSRVREQSLFMTIYDRDGGGREKDS